MPSIPEVFTHAVGGPVLAAVTAHILFRYKEPRSILAYAAVLLLAPAVITASRISASAPLALITTFFSTLALYLFALATSIALYRISPFHPLYAYPGPLLARISRFYTMYSTLDGHQHVATQALHARYGTVVRTGPNHLHICEASAVPVVQGARGGWWRGERYSTTTTGAPGNAAISFIRDPAEHAPRRKIWDRAFSTAALRAYTPLLLARVSELLATLASASLPPITAETGAGTAPTPVDLQHWVELMALDWMGDFAWGGLFHAMETGSDEAGFAEMGTRSVRMIHLLGTIPWVGPLVRLRVPAGMRKLRESAQAVVQKRRREGARTRDLFTVLLDEDGESGHVPLSEQTITSEATVAIVAGSHTTSSSLGHALFYLLANPDDFSKLRVELDDAAVASVPDAATSAQVEGISLDVLEKLPFLNAVINETLRLRPIIPDGVPRTPPPDGGAVAVGECIIPVGTTVQIPVWALQRDPRYFAPDPERWWPARWLPETRAAMENKGERIALDTQAYMPFHVGWGACIGRVSALRTMRSVLAALLRRFDLRFAPGFDVGAWERETSTLVARELWVVLHERKV